MTTLSTVHARVLSPEEIARLVDAGEITPIEQIPMRNRIPLISKEAEITKPFRKYAAAPQRWRW